MLLYSGIRGATLKTHTGGHANLIVDGLLHADELCTALSDYYSISQRLDNYVEFMILEYLNSKH